jgi:tripartite-type tricarboxylate transporter receptor subunit TctC
MARNIFGKLVAAGFVSATLLAGGAQAQDYPSGPVTVVVGFAPGGSADASARFFAQKLGEVFGQSFIVENRVGASGLLAVASVAQAPADGRTLLYGSQTNIVVSPIFNPDTPVDPTTDLIGAVSTGTKPVVLVVDPDLPIHSVDDLIAYARENPNALAYGSGGLGTSPHLSGMTFAQMADIEMRHITYNGENPGVLDVLGKRLQVMFASSGAVMPHVESGDLRALAVTSAERIEYLPDLPAISEFGLEGYDVQSWSGLMAPAGTPDEILQALNDKMQEVLAMPETQTFLAAEGIVPLVGSPAEFHAFVEAEAEKWAIALADAVETQ